jgi:hypothetical protein
VDKKDVSKRMTEIEDEIDKWGNLSMDTTGSSTEAESTINDLAKEYRALNSMLTAL